MANYTGTEGPDVYVGTPGDDVISGLGGNDVLHGGDGNDQIQGDDGDDMLYGDAGNDSLDGGYGDDLMSGGDGNDFLVDGAGNDTIQGDAGNDAVFVDLIFGFSALDHISGGSGIDTFYVMGQGRILNFDLLNVADDFERLFALTVNVVIATDRLNHFQAVTADSVRLTTAGSVIFNASFLVPVITLSDLGNSLDLSAAGSSPYVVTGGAGNDIIHGGGDADDLSGGGGMDLLDGGAGDDILHVKQGEISAAGDHYIGGSGTDTLFIDGPDYDLATDISAAIVDSDIETLDGIDVRGTRAQIAGFKTILNHAIYITDGGALNLTGQSFTGTLHLSDAGNQVTLSKTAAYREIDGGAGADTIIGGDHGTIYRAGGGDDLVYGGSGVEEFFYDEAGNDLYNGGGGTDYFFINAQTTAGDQFIGGAGTDFIEFVGTPVDLSTLNIAADIEGIMGTDLHLTVAQASRFTAIRSDVLTLTSAGSFINSGFIGRTLNLSDLGNNVDLSGSSRSYAINGGAGADTIIGSLEGNIVNGGGGDDVIVGGVTGDQIDGGTGADSLYGGAGNDLYVVDNQADMIFENVGQGYDTVRSTAAAYYLPANVEALELLPRGGDSFGVGNELDNRITCYAVSNTVWGGGGADLIYGNEGADFLYGEDGNDTLIGGGGNDYIVGGAGNDVLNGKSGNDEMFGEGGADIFVFEAGTGRDLIRDFQTGIDKIDLTGFGLTSYADVQAHMLQNKHATVIDLGHGDVLVVQGVFNADFSPSDFII